MAALPERSELFELYKIALEEYRYEVSLSWDRLKHYFVVNAGLTTIGATLLKTGSGKGSSMAMDLVVSAVFWVGLFAAALGIMSIFRSREYYRVTVFKKAQLEKLLGYDQPVEPGGVAHASLAINTTRGMRKSSEVMNSTDADLRALRLQPGSLVFYAAIALALTGMIDSLFAGFLMLRNVWPLLRSIF